MISLRESGGSLPERRILRASRATDGWTTSQNISAIAYTSLTNLKLAAERHLNGRGHLQAAISPLPQRARGWKTGSGNVPSETFFVLCLKLLVGRCQNVECGKRAGDIEEQGSKSKILARTNPVIESCGSIREWSLDNGVQHMPSS